MGRVVKTIYPDGNYSRQIYDKTRQTTIGTAYHAATKESDGNRIISAVYEGEYPEPDPVLPAPFYSVTTTGTTDSLAVTSTEGETINTTLDMLGRKLTYEDPDMGTWTYTYDENGNLLTQTDANGQVTGFDYDSLNRVLHKYYNGSLNTTWLYDGLDDTGNPSGEDHGFCAGALTKVLYPGGSESYTYDERGRVTEIRKTIGTRTRAVSFTYDSADRVVTETYPTGEVITYTYGECGNLVRVRGNRSGDITTYADSITCTAQGKLEAILLGNGITTTYKCYDDEIGDPSNGGRTHSGRLRSINIEDSMGMIIAHTDYQYDANGNIVFKDFYDDAGNFYTEHYTYDFTGRLREAEAPGLYGPKTYTYAPNNNILEKDGRLYIYNAVVDGRTLPHAVSEVQDASGNPLFTYEYDANGNMTQANGMSKITIRAKGTGVADEPPEMELWLAGEKQMGWVVTSTDYQEYTWFGCWDGMSKVDVVFVNDNQASGEETGLHVDWIEVNGVKQEAEGINSEYDRGNYASGCFDGVDVLPGQEQLDVTGALRVEFVGVLTISRTLECDEENRMIEINDNGRITSFTYDTGGQRIKKEENSVTTYYFFGCYEEVVENSTTTGVSYYFANGQRIAQRTESGTETELLYIHTDHLGSAVRLTDKSGEIVQSIAYDPFGQTVYAAGSSNPAYRFTGQELDSGTGLYYYDARYYDPVLGRFIQADTVLDGLNRYAYCGNNPVMYTDPGGHFIVPALIIGGCILAGAYAGGAIVNQDINPVNWDWSDSNTWYGIGAGALIGGFTGGLVTAGIAGLAGTASAWGLTTAAGEATIGWGITTSVFNGAAVTMGTYAGRQVINGGDITAEGLFKNGLVGGISGGFTASGGFGLMYGAKALGGGGWTTAAGLLTHGIGTFGRSVGMNWANGRDLFSTFNIGIGPVNLAFRDGGLSGNWRDWVGCNIGNITTNSIGLANVGVSKVSSLFKNAPNWLTSGKVVWDWQNLTPIYSGGLLQSIGYSGSTAATGAYVVAGNSSYMTNNLLKHEFHHIWQSRMLGDAFLINYTGQGILSLLMGINFFLEANYYEAVAYGMHWY